MKKKKIFCFILTFAIAILGIAFTQTNVKAATYYVDPKGSDSNSGTSRDYAWKTLAKVNSVQFLPGDKILFKSGAEWNGQLHPKGSGNENHPIEINKYGGKEKPLINGNGTSNYVRNSGTVMLINQHDWVISNLEVTNYSSQVHSQRSGILVINNGNTPEKNITIANNFVHDVNSDTQVDNAWKVTGGIILIGINEDLDGKINNNKNFGFQNISVTGNQVKNVATAGIRNKTTMLYSNGSESYPKLNKNISYENNRVDDVFGDGLIISEVASDGIVKNNIVNKFCNANTSYNYAGLWVMSSDNVVVERNEVANGRYGSNDGTAFDIDLNCNNVIVQHNYSHDNARGTVLFMNYSKNGVFRYNVSVNDGWDNNKLISYLPEDNAEKVDIYNNLFITNPYTAEIFKTSSKKRALRFVNNVIISQSEKLKTFNYDDMTGDINICNNATYGFNDKWFTSGENIKLQNPVLVEKLLSDIQDSDPGINNLNITKLLQMSELQKAGTTIASNITDFSGNPISINPSIGPLEFK